MMNIKSSRKCLAHSKSSINASCYYYYNKQFKPMSQWEGKEFV